MHTLSINCGYILKSYSCYQHVYNFPIKTCEIVEDFLYDVTSTEAHLDTIIIRMKSYI